MDDPSPEESTETPPGVPRWLKLSLVALAVVVVVIVAVLALAGGEHGPGRHALGVGPDVAATRG